MPRLHRTLAVVTGVLVGLWAVGGTAAGQTTSCISRASSGNPPSGLSTRGSISASGRFVVFESYATNLVPGDTNGVPDVFVHDRHSGLTSRVSVSTAGTQGDAYSYMPSISDDGRYVAFLSFASNLVSDDTSLTVGDIFVRDRRTGLTSRVSVDSAGVEGNDTSRHPSISGDGRHVAFMSSASNLVSDDTNAVGDIFVHDRQTGQMARVSVDSTGVQGNAVSDAPSISDDGRYVAFRSFASNLVPDDTNGFSDVFVHDRQTGQSSRVSVDSAGVQGNGVSEGPPISSGPSLSGDGRYVAFGSRSTNLVSDDTNGYGDVFVHDRDTGQTSRVSVDSSGGPANDRSHRPSISADGRFVAFESAANNLVSNDTNNGPLDPKVPWPMDVFVHDRQTGETWRASVDSAGVEGNYESGGATISDDGIHVAFVSVADNLVSDDTNLSLDVFVHDSTPCSVGTVNAGVGVVYGVLRVNGERGQATVSRGEPIEVEMLASPAGPASARHGLWIWLGRTQARRDLVVAGARLGCTVNVTPFHPLASSQPFRCMRGGLPPRVCGSAMEVTAPPRAPWLVTRAQGIGRALEFTLQGLLEDAGAANAVGYSVTNAVNLEVR